EQSPPAAWSDPKYGFGVSGEVPRSLFRMPYELEARRIMNDLRVNLFPARAKRISEARYICRRFLRRPITVSVWFAGDPRDAVGGPLKGSRDSAAGAMNRSRDAATGASNGSAEAKKSVLILHRKALGQSEPWMISRVGLDGGVQWTADTGLADVH